MDRSIVTRLPRLAAVFNTEAEAQAALERFGSAMMPRSENAELDVVYAQGGWMVCVVLTGSHVGRTYWLADHAVAAVAALEAPGGCGAAHKAGRAYWQAHRAFWQHGETPAVEALAGHARSCGWHGADCEAWLAGFYGEKHRDAIAALEAPGGCGAARLAIIWTARSSNKKTGPMPVSTTSKETCAPVCPFKGNGCYAESGPLAALWAKLTETGPGGVFQSGVAKVRTIDWRGLCASVAALAAGTVWRHNQAGDLPHKGGRIVAEKLRALVRANRGRRGFTYTHHNVLQSVANRALIAEAVAAGFVINLSGNSPAHADRLADLEIAPVVTVLPEDAPRNGRTPAGRPIVVCPATYREDVSCITCQLCAREREAIVGFPVHGARRRRAAEIAEKGV